MRDFTLDTYRELLETLQRKGYQLIGYADYVKGKAENEKFAILRHDVDTQPENSLKTAQIEHALGIKATYYFRCVKESNRPEIIRAITSLGHEIGYHYEDMSLCNGNTDEAWSHFQTWLAYFRQYYAVETICMHGAPMSKWDGKALWKKYDYRTVGVIGEPYMDTDFEQIFYLTDTGRCWDGYKVSVRDKIPGMQEQWTANGLTWHTTPQILQAIETDRMPAHVMIVTHPQRWTNNKAAWLRELILQTTKNWIKKLWIRN